MGKPKAQQTKKTLTLKEQDDVSTIEINQGVKV